MLNDYVAVASQRTAYQLPYSYANQQRMNSFFFHPLRFFSSAFVFFFFTISFCVRIFFLFGCAHLCVSYARNLKIVTFAIMVKIKPRDLPFIFYIYMGKKEAINFRLLDYHCHLWWVRAHSLYYIQHRFKWKINLIF